ncbi:VOC family protein [Streptomyces sp. NPDC007971]|uniref:VOC family protein n=1 Tax=Streptomyces sp. NPDC007971 TaxID=3364799 RepID=UPI0036E14528
MPLRLLRHLRRGNGPGRRLPHRFRAAGEAESSSSSATVNRVTNDWHAPSTTSRNYGRRCTGTGVRVCRDAEPTVGRSSAPSDQVSGPGRSWRSAHWSSSRRRTASPELCDPSNAVPTVWFQTSGSEEPRQRWHPDVWVDPAQVQSRIDAALTVGGTLVSDAEAPSFWVLADPEGNRVCLCTWQGRG